jgi:hypothetical protein
VVGEFIPPEQEPDRGGDPSNEPPDADPA